MLGLKKQMQIEKLNQMVLNLKLNMKDEEGKWVDKIKIAANDNSSTNDQCIWLQSQMDHLQSQLLDAHERIKGHEQEKAQLAQKVLAAEEER